MDFDHSDSDDGNRHSHEDTLKKAREGSKTDSDIEEYLPPKRTLTAKKAPVDVKKVVQRDHMSVKMKNKRVPPSRQDIRKLEARNTWMMIVVIMIEVIYDNCIDAVLSDAVKKSSRALNALLTEYITE